MNAHPRLASRLFNTVLMAHPGKAASALLGIGGRITGKEIEIAGGPAPVHHVAFAHGRPSFGTISDRMGRALDQQRVTPYDMVGNVAVIPIEGTLVHKGAWLESDSGETSYQGIQTQVSRALRDPVVKGVAFEVDSYGGEVAGAFETSDMIFELSKAKPTIAILSDDAYSAGYLLASAARQVVMPATGGAGSIGVMTLHTDMSMALEMRGLKVTILAAGAHKADGNPLEPLPEPVATAIRSELESMRAIFAARVGRYRGSRFTRDQAMATEAASFMAEDAVRLGLADAIGHPSDAFEAFVSFVNRA